jgi:acyl-CoA thioester hydrolase
MPAVDGFRFRRLQTVEFRDVDGLGHVNNAVYVSYLESARLAYMQEVLEVEHLEDLGIVAEVTVSFRSPAFLGETLEVGVRVAETGGKSLRFEYEVRGPNGRLVAEARSVHVAFDYETRTSVAVPDEWRRRIETHEPRSLATT